VWTHALHGQKDSCEGIKNEDGKKPLQRIRIRWRDKGREDIQNLVEKTCTQIHKDCIWVKALS